MLTLWTGYDSEVARQVLPNQLTTTGAPSSSESYTLVVVVVAGVAAVVLGSGTVVGAYVCWRKKFKRARTEEPGTHDDGGRRVDDPLLQDEEPAPARGQDLPGSGQLAETVARVDATTLKLPVEEENPGNLAGAEKAIN